MAKVIVITGGTGQIGRAVTQKFAERGDTVIHIARSDRQVPGVSRSYACSITDTPKLKTVVADIAKNEGRVDALINCAGISAPHGFKELTDDVIDNILITNVRGTFAVIREFSDLLQAGSVVVNVSSLSGSRASQSNFAYGASKAGVDLLTKSLAKFLAPKVRVVGVAPSYLPEPTTGIPRVAQNRPGLNKAAPIGRVCQPKDVADAIFNLCDNMTFVNGQTIIFDGGMSL